MVLCDRCGKEYDYAPYKFSAWMSVYMTYPNIFQNSNIINLCPECQEELRKWLEKGNENGKTQL